MNSYRYLNYKNIFIKTIIYRIFIIGIQTIFTYLYINAFKDMNYSNALNMSIIWNIINVILYFSYECIFAKQFKMSRDEGFVLWFTGPSGVGKSTLADAVNKKKKKYSRRTERLDGDIVRQSLCSDLRFSKKDRNSNIKRVTFVSKMLSKNGVGVLASFISPYIKIRQYVRENTTNFIEVHLIASKYELINRDPKGLYAKAKAGKIKNLTGFDGEYQKPLNSEISINTEKETLKDSVQIVINYLKIKKLI